MLPLSEQVALDAFFVSLGGANWTVSSGWVNGTATEAAVSSDPCGDPGWFGVTCAALGNASHVTGLRLPTNNLRGALLALVDLPFLEVFDLSNGPGASSESSNAVRGTLAALCGLIRIKTVTLARNSLTGELPACLGTLVAVTTLDVNFNAVEGTTDFLCGLKTLKVLRLRGNRLRGTVPACLGDLAALNYLDYSNINSDGSSPGPQSLEGTLPAKLCGLTKLEKMMFQFTQGLSGRIPDCWGRGQPLLNTFDLQGNLLTGTVPVSLCEAPQLWHLLLYRNELAGPIPACFENNANLEWLDFHTNSLTGHIPETLCNIPELQFLILRANKIEGTVPTCLGSNTNLQRLQLDTNSFTGGIPESLCNLHHLQYLYLYGNNLDGTLPGCFGTSFPDLETMLLHDNRFHGRLPEAWNLPSLTSIVLSNNAGLNGPLPSGIFSQQNLTDTSALPQKNINLRAVVIEGTRLHGTVPIAVCDATELQTLALSGNFLTGHLPDCLTSLTGIKTLRAAHNQLTGPLFPELFIQCASLMNLDLSNNGLSGTVPAELGDVSVRLVNMSLEQNYLSCELPASVRHWTAAANASKKNVFQLLKGNLFGCGGSILALTMKDAGGLRRANTVDADSFSCGAADYVQPVFALGLVVAPVVAAIVILWVRGLLSLGWRANLSWRTHHSLCVEELHEANVALNRLGVGAAAAALASAALVCGLLLWTQVTSPLYMCEYATAATLANKAGSGGGDNMTPLSVGLGVALGVGLILGMAVWWLPWLTPDLEDQDLGAQRFHERFSAEREAESQTYHGVITSRRALVKAGCIVLGTVVAAVGPNVVYVLIVLSDLSHAAKLESEAAVTLTKMTFSTLIVPFASRWVARLLVPGEALSFVRFRVRIVLGTALAAITTIVGPASIVLVIDERCLYHAWHPPDTVTTDVNVEFCLQFNADSTCAVHSDEVFQSTYTPSFSYDGSRCVSAILSVYAPVFLAAVLLSATIPAALELLVVPALAPWCHRNRASSFMARRLLAILFMLTRNVLPTLAAAQNVLGQQNPSTSPNAFTDRSSLAPHIDVDHLAQCVMERGLTQLVGTLLVALTFGLGAPSVGAACALAALVQLAHHRHVLSTIIACGIADRRRSPGGRVPNLKGCCYVPRSCSVVVTATVLLVWGCASVDFLDPVPLACAAVAAGLTCALLWLGCIRVLRVWNDDSVRENDIPGTPSQEMMPQVALIAQQTPVANDPFPSGGESRSSPSSASSSAAASSSSSSSQPRSALGYLDRASFYKAKRASESPSISGSAL